MARKTTITPICLRRGRDLFVARWWIGLFLFIAGAFIAPNFAAAAEAKKPRAAAPATSTAESLESLEAALAQDPNRLADVRRYVRRELQVSPAADETVDQARLVKLVAALRKIISATGEKPPAQRPIEHFEDRLFLVSAMGLQLPAPIAQRVLYLMDQGDDAGQLSIMAHQALRECETFRRDVDEAAEAATADWEKLAIGMPARLQELKAQVEYRSAWIRFYLAVATDKESAEDNQRQFMLDTAVAIAAAHAGSTQEDSALRLQATLLCGMALCQQGQFERARPLLQTAAAESSPPKIRIQAMFELAKLLAGQGQWQAAQDQIITFAQAGKQILGPSASLDVDLHHVFFMNYLLNACAGRTAAQDANQAATLRQQAEQILGQVLLMYPRKLTAISPLISARYEDCEDVENLATGILLAKSVAHMIALPPDYPSAAADLERVLARSSNDDQAYHPLALWQLATCLYSQASQQSNSWPLMHRAAARFGELARRFPQDPCAPAAAVNAANILEARLANFSSAEARRNPRRAHRCARVDPRSLGKQQGSSSLSAAPGPPVRTIRKSGRGGLGLHASACGCGRYQPRCGGGSGGRPELEPRTDAPPAHALR